jgi:hypothetical protein
MIDSFQGNPVQFGNFWQLAATCILPPIHFEKLPMVANSCKKLPNVAKKLPKVANNYKLIFFFFSIYKFIII